MQDQDRQAISGLFARLAQVGRQAPHRDAEAEAYIAEEMRRQPGSAYYMAQTIVAQEAALTEAQRRITEMESRPAAQAGGGFLSRLFGPAQQAPARPAPAPRPMAPPAQQQSQPPAGGAWGPAPRAGGGGFLAGAAQTAVGVAGGMMMANMLTGMLAGDETQVAEAPPEEAPVAEEAAYEEPADAGGFDDFEEI